MDCGFYQTFMRWTLEGDRDAHKFTLANAFKDMRYLESMADAAGLANPLGNAVKNSYALPWRPAGRRLRAHARDGGGQAERHHAAAEGQVGPSAGGAGEFPHRRRRSKERR